MQKKIGLFFMANTERYETVIQLNTEQAKKEMAELTDKVRILQLEQKKYTEGTKEYARIQKQIDKTNKDLEKMALRTKTVGNTLNSLSDAKPKELKKTISEINKMLSSNDVERGSVMWRGLTSALKEAKAELAQIEGETKASQSAWSRFTKFLNDSWGGLTMIISSAAGVTMTVRKVVQDFAQMEEAMADVRKYTGMTDNEVRDLNESLKAMDTRTSREELNELAGAAGRLGKTAKEDILDFVEAGNMIKVSLGDDLGEGAIDQVGKLAMAFGEDDNMGLRKAMLATGSAVNELAQNSSAKAGYLVDFTARVAGFGKQLGLTQAQIMGFGAVMDENLLRDEMASTAFGNMLTKMQTDTAKFAKIAGKDVKEFSDLLNNDANAAILALADSLKAADPQTMMKMLDDMGLDGARAVGVLSTMADKIDDVRERQQLATKAYAEATSVGDEYNRMNETVQAQIDKAKKHFHEMSVELGEQLLPVVKYTITSGSAMVKVLGALVTLMTKSKATIISVGLTIAVLTAYRKADVMWSKLQIFWNEKLLVALANLKKALVTNPWTAAFVAIAAVVGIIIDLVRSSDDAAKKQRELTAAEREHKAMAESMKTVTEEANKATAEEITKLKMLRKTLEDNTKKYGERKKALDEIKKMVPSYHGELTTENTLINNNTKALDDYVTSLQTAARAQAAFNRMVTLQDESLTHEEELRKRKGNRQWAENKLKELGVPENVQFVSHGERKWNMYDENGKFIKRVSNQQKEQIDHYKDLVRWNKERIKEEEEILDINRKQSDELQKIVDKGKPEEKKTKTEYVSDSEQKKLETAREKAESERLKKLREDDKKEKAFTDARLAENMLKYQAGEQDYRQYTANMQKIQENGLRARMAVWDEESAEYKKYQKQLAALQLNGDKETMQLRVSEYERIYKQTLLVLEQEFNTEGSAIYQNEIEYQKKRYKAEMDFLLQKKELTRKGSLERMQIEWDIEDRENEHKLQNHKAYMERLSKYREEMAQADYDRLQQIELAGAESLYNALLADGKMTKDEYDAIIEHIRRKYAGLKAEQAANTDIQAKASASLDTAKKNAGVKDMSAGDNAATGIFSISEAVRNQKLINAQLQELYGEDYENNREYQEAKRQLDQETMQQIVAGAQAAYQTIGQFMSAASAYAQASSDLEVAKITANYDKQIEAAGNNTKKKEKLEKERDKKIADAKTKANKKAMVMEMAQAVAQTAMGAISAYSSTMAGAPYPANLILAPISAGIALAAGALQIATIKKQHQAEEAGYYEGGFTGGHRYRREAGVVHEGEFVANHQAVNNPNILPFLTFLDQAQRNNTVGSLSAQDVSRSMGAGTSQLLAPIVNVNVDNERLNDSIDRINENQDRLASQLEQGIGVDFPMDTFDKSYKHYSKLNER